MTVYRLEREQVVPRPVDDVFALFAEARKLEALTPAWLHFELLTQDPIEMRRETLIEYRLRLHRVPVRWISRIEQWELGRSFVDRQVRRPYRLWHHLHEFASHPDGTVVRDQARYELPFGPLGAAAHAAFVRRDLDRIFDFRREAVARLLP